MTSTYGPNRDDPAGGERGPQSSQSGVHESSRDDRTGTGGFDRDQAEREAREAVGNARDELQSLVESQKNAAAEQVHAVADALRQTAHRLREKEQNSVAAYVGHIADRIDYWAGQLRDRHVQQLGQDVQQLASRQPALFIAGAVVVGFAATRFLKSTQASGDRDSNDPGSDRASTQSCAAFPAASKAPISADGAATDRPGPPTEPRAGDSTSADHFVSDEDKP